MTIQLMQKLNQLQHILPEGLLVDAAWLEQNGYSRALKNQYVAAGWLAETANQRHLSTTTGQFKLGTGCYIFANLTQSSCIFGWSFSFGVTRLLSLSIDFQISHTQKEVQLYCDTSLPYWVRKLPLEQKLIINSRQRLFTMEESQPVITLEKLLSNENSLLHNGLEILTWGHWNWPMIVSRPERAYLELLDQLPDKETFHMADVLMEGLANISPRRMQSLLENVESIKVKRLFFFFAQRHSHQWFKRLDQNKIDLGTGKRVLVKGGVLDSEYLITVPPEFKQESNDGL